MPLEAPKIDSRTYQDIFNEARARIPVHNPEWTNFNNSDPGITLLQLFSFMTENLIYRVNQIPERNRKKFLKLLGIPMNPAAPAFGMVSFSNPKGPLQTPVTLEKNQELLAGQVPFLTRDGLSVLPIEAQVYYKASVSPERKAEMEKYELYESFRDPDAIFGYYETRLLEPPSAGTVFPSINLTPGDHTVDGCLWLALLARKAEELQGARQAIAGQILTLGILPAFTNAERALMPGGPSIAADQPILQFLIPVIGPVSQEKSERIARYRLLDAKAIDNILAEPGIVKLPLPGVEELQLWQNYDPLEAGVGDFPPYLEDTDLQDRIITWIRIQMPEGRRETKTAGQISAAISWIGINAARVIQSVRILNEQAGRGSGEPDQVVKLANKPVIPESLQLRVNNVLWTQIEDLRTAGSEVPVSESVLPGTGTDRGESKKVNVYTLDRESGEVRFGDGEYGARPSYGALITANYDYGGGRQGTVGIGAINKGSQLPSGIKVTNPVPTWGADEGETLEEAEKQVTRVLQHGNRLVTREDFQNIASRTPGVDIARTVIMPLFHPELTDIPAEGVVTVMVIPKYDPVHPETPEPDRLFIDAVCRHLDRRRLITTEIRVLGPTYIPVWVSVGIDVFPGEDIETVREAVKEAIRTYLSPIKGGHDEKGWPLNTDVEKLELMVAAARVKGVSKVVQVLLTDNGAEKESIPMKGLGLPRLAAVAVQSGIPQPLPDMRGDAGGTSGGRPEKIIPVPVIPPECR